MPKRTLTQQFVDSCSVAPKQSKTDYFDTKVNGLLLKVLKSGKRNYYLRYKNAHGKTCERRLSSVDATGISLREARELAQKKLAMIAMGEDPFAVAEELKEVLIKSLLTRKG